MKLREEFVVPYGLAEVWRFFEQPTAVAGCMPGVESVSVIDDDHVQVRATQSIGPMTATFEANVTVTERVPDELIRFRAVGRTVRGAVGNLRTDNVVRLAPGSDGTRVTVEGDVVLAGAIGSVGQKIVAKQAGKVTAEFAANLQRALAGGPALSTAAPTGATSTAAAPNTTPTAGAPALTGSPPAPAWPVVPLPVTGPASPLALPPAERWAKAAAALSALSVVLDVLGLLRQRRGARP